MAAGFLLVSLLTSLAGFVNAVFAKSFEQINGMISFVLVPLTYCGGVFFSISLLPGWARLLALANPVLYMVELFRWCMLGASDIHVGVAVCSMLVMSLILFAVATGLTQRGVGIKE
jgi:ABC-2 type transport system permease protein